MFTLLFFVKIATPASENDEAVRGELDASSAQMDTDVMVAGSTSQGSIPTPEEQQKQSPDTDVGHEQGQLEPDADAEAEAGMIDGETDAEVHID